ncbi:hypothetical protein [Ramlibacter montanisoli]|uniref:Uncharacterized protein n=1 Tax=Ramlibacter montanisoli TaxID=2732512 RepID=A0A849KB02_9BURK|nr:hypothetical protein [Ramlibacter montanisoli]NNU45502.1 hypothetical protein [Ramlibacter montanisoli]
MPNASPGLEQEGELPPPGSRWGAGAGSVLPYLSRSLQARPASAHDTSEAGAHDEQQAPGQEHPSASAG